MSSTRLNTLFLIHILILVGRIELELKVILIPLLPKMSELYCPFWVLKVGGQVIIRHSKCPKNSYANSHISLLLTSVPLL